MTEVLDVRVLLLLPYRAMEGRVFDGLAAAGFGDITRAQARVFQRIDDIRGCRAASAPLRCG